ncbi:MAG: hypothetical protein H6Q33_1433 [Deltaproteobacteria bacterium]|nr:hypothetical protein [Deltaproteobacteria bacterium]
MFLKPMLDTPDAPWTLRNARNGLVLARKLEPAFDSKARRRGLLGRQGLDVGAALIIAPCNSIHTFFMKFAIDVVFVSRDGRVAKVYQALPAWRIGVCWNSFAVIELAAGAAARAKTRVADDLQIVR